jgi:MT0933-like antitoxin protein
MRILPVIAVLLVLASGSLMASACEKPKGPAEKAGEKVDKAVDKVSDAVNPKGPVEKAGRAVDRATDN